MNMKQLDSTADDALDEIGRRSAARVEHADQSAVAQHGRAIGDLHHFADIVADEDHARALRDDPAHEREQLIDADARQERRRLVEHQQAPAPASPLAEILDRAHDRKQRLLGRREVAIVRARIEVEAIARAASRRRLMLARARKCASRPLVGKTREAEILGQRQGRDQRQILMHEGQAQRLGVLGPNRQRDILPEQTKCARRAPAHGSRRGF